MWKHADSQVSVQCKIRIDQRKTTSGRFRPQTAAREVVVQWWHFSIDDSSMNDPDFSTHDDIADIATVIPTVSAVVLARDWPADRWRSCLRRELVAALRVEPTEANRSQLKPISNINIQYKL